MPSGRSGSTVLTWSRTSCAATSTSFSSVNVTNDLRDALGRDRAQLVDAADGVDRLLDLVGDLGLDLLGRGAGQARDDGDEGKSTLGNWSTPSLHVADDADDDDDEDQHRREDGAPDADAGEPLHGVPHSTRAPSRTSGVSVGDHLLAGLEAAHDGHQAPLRARRPAPGDPRGGRSPPRRRGAAVPSARTAVSGTAGSVCSPERELGGHEHARPQVVAGVVDHRLDDGVAASACAPTGRRSGSCRGSRAVPLVGGGVEARRSCPAAPAATSASGTVSSTRSESTSTSVDHPRVGAHVLAGADEALDHHPRTARGSRCRAAPRRSALARLGRRHRPLRGLALACGLRS